MFLSEYFHTLIYYNIEQEYTLSMLSKYRFFYLPPKIVEMKTLFFILKIKNVKYLICLVSKLLIFLFIFSFKNS